MTNWHRVPAVAVLSGALLCAGTASAQGAVQVPSASTSPTPTPAPAVVPGRAKLIVKGALGNPPFVIAGRQMVVRGSVVPYVAGQTVKVTIFRDGRKVKVKRVSVIAVGDGSGQFHIAYASAATGILQAWAVHDATPQQGSFRAHSGDVPVSSTNLGPGARGPWVRLLQSELNALHFAVPLSGVFDEATGRAVTAYRKLTGLARVSYTNLGVFELLQRGAGSFRVRYRGDGRHVEADLTRQVLAEVEPGGRVRSIYTMSSGKPSTPTVIGHFWVYSKTPGVNSHGMVDSNYFISGYAIHGYPEVPTYAASHGCLRVPIPDAASIYWWVHMGTAVDVYNESGGGSRRVNSRAGP
jgi:peptidoglycan hydrolase-like protein with peptidoglycan-binding domain